MVDDDTWPPEQLKNFTPLLLMYYQGNHNPKQVAAMTKLMQRGDNSIIASGQMDVTQYSAQGSHETLHRILDGHTVTEKIEEVLTPLENSHESCFILIEGAPGIGRTVLLKEIAYLWGIGHILQLFKIVLLISLRDPSIQKVKSIPDLLNYFCRGDPDAIKIVTTCSKYIFNNGGKDLVFLFDGFDELPDRLRTKGLIADILKRRVLPFCGLVVSSRPHVTEYLHKQATLKVDILGFTKRGRHHHIQKTLQGQAHKIEELTQYFKHHLTISGLCYIPFNLIVLIYLYKHGIPLPKNSTELYSYFICLTICRQLTKYGQHVQNKITQLKNLPDPYNRVVLQLAKLSLEALDSNKLIFNIDEINSACPDITVIPGAINGFGLLQAVQHFDLTGTTMTFSFVHYSIQEYLAAYHITSLPYHEELKIIEEKFWIDTYFNIFSIYTTLTKGQRSSFKHFLSGGDKSVGISDKFLNNQLQCFHLYHCFHEAGDFHTYKIIEQAEKFRKKRIYLRYAKLTANDVECIAVFLTSSFHKEWMIVDMFRCFICDHGIHIMYHRLSQFNDITINELWLSDNGLTTQSCSLISEITVKCRVKVLGIGYNDFIGEDWQLYSMLSDHTTMLEELYMIDTKLSSTAAVGLFKALKDNSKLQVLNIKNNAITNDVCDVITSTLCKNSCLVKLHMSGNPLTGEAAVKIVNAVKDNSTLAELTIPNFPKDVKKTIGSLQEVICQNRERKGCEVKLVIDYF